jgi:hypothetical protein
MLFTSAVECHETVVYCDSTLPDCLSDLWFVCDCDRHVVLFYFDFTHMEGPGRRELVLREVEDH